MTRHLHDTSPTCDMRDETASYQVVLHFKYCFISSSHLIPRTHDYPWVTNYMYESLIYMHDKTHSYVWNGSFICMTLLIFVFGMVVKCMHSSRTSTSDAAIWYPGHKAIHESWIYVWSTNCMYESRTIYLRCSELIPRTQCLVQENMKKKREQKKERNSVRSHACEKEIERDLEGDMSLISVHSRKNDLNPALRCNPDQTRDRDCLYYIIAQTYDVGLLSRRHLMELQGDTSWSCMHAQGLSHYLICWPQIEWVMPHTHRSYISCQSVMSYINTSMRHVTYQWVMSHVNKDDIHVNKDDIHVNKDEIHVNKDDIHVNKDDIYVNKDNTQETWHVNKDNTHEKCSLVYMRIVYAFTPAVL